MTLPSLIPQHDLDTLCDLASTAPPGAFVELGVFKGGSAARLYQVAQQQGRQLYLFDTFSGHPIVTEHDDAVIHHVGRFSDSIDPKKLQALLPLANIYVGTFPDTLPADLSDVAFVHCDMDLYAPTLAACKLMPPRMVSGGLMLFDDYRYQECPGVEKAIIEVFGGGRVLPNGKMLITVRH